jgi:hypothetical protein
MWPLRWFRYDDGIDSPEVYFLDGPGEAELMSRDEVARAVQPGLRVLNWVAAIRHPAGES